MYSCYFAKIPPFFLMRWRNDPLSTMTSPSWLQCCTWIYRILPMHKHLKWFAAECANAYCMEWILNMTTNYTADQLVFLDESSQDEHIVQWRYSCAPSGQAAVHHISFNWGVQYSTLPILSLDGYMTMKVVEGSIYGAKFHGMNDVVSCLNSWYSWNANELYFQYFHQSHLPLSMTCSSID